MVGMASGTDACADPAMGPARPWTCREAVSALRRERADIGRDILAGFGTAHDGHVIRVYGDTPDDIAGLPATHLGFRVLAEVLPRRPKGNSHAVR